MRALEFVTGHIIYNLAYTQILQTTTTYIPLMKEYSIVSRSTVESYKEV